MSAEPARREPGDPIPLHDRAIRDLNFIRDTMARAGTVTSVPGWGGVGMGVVACGAAYAASRQATPAEWLAVWLGSAAIALGVGGIAMVRKAEKTRSTLWSRAGRLFAGAFAPAIVAGAVLTAVLYNRGLTALLPGVWLILYGAAVASAGVFSVRPVPLLGACFIVVGSVALIVSPAYGDLLMAIGFGGLQIGFGAAIARWYGG